MKPAIMSHDEMGYAHRSTTIPMPKLPRPLTSDEKKYLLAVDRADVATVKRMINQALAGDSVLNIDCVDALGRGALLMAIEAENIDMVQTLVVMGVRTGDALLHAIQNQFVEAVELLLEHEELVHKEGMPYSWESVDRDTANFTTDITPLLLASHTNNYEILKILLDRGATIPMPHDIRCSCNECTEGVKQDSLRYSASRINSYKALASSSLIALTSVDPLLTAFELSWELKQLGSTEYEFRQEYQELRKNTQEFAVKLLGHVRTSKELQIMLDYDPAEDLDENGSANSSAEGRNEYGLARLRLAINYKQKKFVAHPWVQQLLSSMWYDGLPGFRQKSSISKALEIVRIIAFSPFYCMVYMLAPRSASGRLMRKPFMKFLTHAASYLFFLLLLILVSQRAEVRFIDFWDSSLRAPDEKTFAEAPPTRKQHRGNFPQYLEYMVLFYVIGFVIEETRELFKDGLKAYVSNMWNIIDFLRNALYCIVALLRVWAILEQLEEIKVDPERAYIPREDWTDFDPQLIAEGLFAAANIVSALKLVQLSTINPHLGPLQISLGRMVFDILKFFFFYTLVLFAFASGLNQLLWYFADLERQKCYTLPDGLADWKNSPEACMRWRRFGSLFESSQSLFWASFGMIGLDDFELSGIKSYTRFWGLLMFGSYCVINVIVLLNLLIAMLSNTYAEIAQRADTEWKFARTKLWLSYFDEDAPLPSPFNIVPRPKQLARLILRYVPFKEMKAAAESVKAHHLDLKEQGLQYTAVMRALIWRYVSGMQRKSEEEPISTDDITEVKGEISALRYDLKELFSQNGMNVQSMMNRQNTGAKKSREWERRLMSGFHVAPAAGDASVNEMAKEKCLMTDVDQKTGETGAARFRRMARLAILNRERLNRPSKHLCHIGRSTSDDSLRSRHSLKRAMDEVQRAKAPQLAPAFRNPANLAIDKLHQNSIEIEAPVLGPVVSRKSARKQQLTEAPPTVSAAKPELAATTNIAILEGPEDSLVAEKTNSNSPSLLLGDTAKLAKALNSSSFEPAGLPAGDQTLKGNTGPSKTPELVERVTRAEKTASSVARVVGPSMPNLVPSAAERSTVEHSAPTPKLSPRFVPTTVKRGWF